MHENRLKIIVFTATTTELHSRDGIGGAVIVKQILDSY